MATVRSTANTVDGSNLTSRSVTLPAGAVAADPLLIFYGAARNADEVTTPSGWVKLGSVFDSNFGLIGVLKKTDGAAGAGGTVTVASTEFIRAWFIAVACNGGDPNFVSIATLGSPAFDVPIHTPAISSPITSPLVFRAVDVLHTDTSGDVGNSPPAELTLVAQHTTIHPFVVFTDDDNSVEALNWDHPATQFKSEVAVTVVVGTAPDPGVPDAPTALVANVGDTQVVLTWSAPAYDGQDAITDYVVEMDDGGGYDTFSDGTSASTGATVTGLTNGTEYDFRVSATNSYGTGAVSNVATGTPTSAPTLVGVSAQVVGNGTGSFNLTPDVSALGCATGDILIAHLGGAASTAAAYTVTPPASQGWTAVTGTPFAHATLLSRMTLHWKRWGGGDTDDTTPTFACDVTGTTDESGGGQISVWRGCVASGTPWEAVASTLDGASAATYTAPTASSAGTDRTSVRFYVSQDDNAHASPSEGLLGYGGTSYDFTTSDDCAMSMSYLKGEPSGALGTATMASGANGSDAWIAVTLILMPVPSSGTNCAAGLASATVTAYGISELIKPSAAVSSATATAYVAKAHLKPVAAVASVASTAYNPTKTVRTNASVATATGTAYDATKSIKPNAAVATVTVTAHSLTATVRASTGLASTVAASYNPSAAVTFTASTASVTATALDATVEVEAATDVDAELASVTVTAYDTTITTAVVVSAELATATATAADVTTTVVVNAELSTVVITAYDSTVVTGTLVAAELASVTVAASDATVTVVATASLTTVVVTAYDATVSTQTNTNAQAELASVSPTAYGATVSTASNTTVDAGCGFVAASTFAVAASISVTTATATVALDARTAKLALLANALVAAISAVAYDATTAQSGRLVVSQIISVLEMIQSITAIEVLGTTTAETISTIGVAEQRGQISVLEQRALIGALG